MILFITVLSFFLLAYVYVGYPVVLYLLASMFGRDWKTDPNLTPKVTMIVACFNEEDVIAEKIQNCVSLDYPQDFIDFVFVSDGSTDKTDDLVKQATDSRVRLIRQEGRLGKTSGLNLAVPQATGEVIVFSDANAMYQTDAVRQLVRNFADEQVGYVVGAALYANADTTAAADSENVYWQYELFLKSLESKLHSVVGGDGAIYAIRASLYEPLMATDINDFVNPLQIVAKGFRGVFDWRAVCYEDAAGDFEKEAKRKKRIVNRSIRGLMRVAPVMNPFVSGFFAFEVISHKLLRWLLPLFLILAGLGSLYLAYTGDGIFRIITSAGLIVTWLAVIGYTKRSSSSLPKLIAYPYYFLMVNFYSAAGVIQAMRGDTQVTWSTARATSSSSRRSAISAFGIYVLLAASLYTVISMVALTRQVPL